jgi:hypothetical protein
MLVLSQLRKNDKAYLSYILNLFRYIEDYNQV